MEYRILIFTLAMALMATLKAQDTYVANFVDTTVGEYGLDGSTVNASLISALDSSSGPTGLAISGNDLFVVNTFGQIAEQTTSGTLVTSSLISRLDNPQSIAISGNDLFVTSTSGTIGEYTTSGATVNTSLISGLDGSRGIAISPEPSAGALAVLGAAALWLWRRREYRD